MYLNIVVDFKRLSSCGRHIYNSYKREESAIYI